MLLEPLKESGYDQTGTRNAMLPVGQLYWPDWSRFVDVFQDIFDREYYTNHGPLVQRLERELELMLGVRNVICVSNATVGLMMAMEALELRKKIVLPAFTFIATAQAVTWVGLEPKFCDVDPETHQIDVDSVESLMTGDVDAILAVNLWGDCCDIEGLTKLAANHRVPLFFDSAHAMGCAWKGRPIGGFGAMEVFSFHATKVLSAAEGGCISTDDDDLAARLRNIRSSYGARQPVSVYRTSNGRLSEAHAAIGLLNLEEMPSVIDRNIVIKSLYEQEISNVPGISLLKLHNVSASNHQYVVCEVDARMFGMTRDRLVKILQDKNIAARRYFYPGAHRSVPYCNAYPEYLNSLPATDQLNQRLLQLPSGAMVKDEDVTMICNIIRHAQQ